MGLDSPGAMLSAVANTPGDRWSVEVLLEARVEEVRGQLPSVGLSLEQDGRRDASAVFDLEPGVAGTLAGRSRLLLRRAAPGRAQGRARTAGREDRHPRKAYGKGGIVGESAQLQGKGEFAGGPASLGEPVLQAVL